MIAKRRQLFPVGTPVILKKESKTGTGTFLTAGIVGTVVEWRYEAAGAWYSENGDPNIPNAGGKLQLLRLRLKKVDGEITDTILDDLTSVAKLEAK
jgi:hypothetical protein